MSNQDNAELLREVFDLRLRLKDAEREREEWKACAERTDSKMLAEQADHNKTVDKLIQLRADLAAAREDTARLDWLDLHISTQETADILGLDYSKCHFIRDAIDSARAGGAVG